MNAIDVLPLGGEIRVGVTAGPRVDGACLIIADNGPGIPDAIRERIFEPFFSTKRSNGTGLGLWISQSIIRKYGGSIRMRTTSDPTHRTGTIFRICLPGHG